MGLFHNLKTRLSGKSYVVPVGVPVVYRGFGKLQQFRRGMWVVVRNHIGIIWDFLPTGELQVHLVDSMGVTVEIQTAQADEIRQARLPEIPKPRRPNVEIAAKFGY